MRLSLILPVVPVATHVVGWMAWLVMRTRVGDLSSVEIGSTALRM